MTNLTQSGFAFENKIQVVTVTDGRRGPIGPVGPAGPDGPQGDSIVMQGPWQFNATYCPGDAVTSRSSLVDNIQSMWVQNETVSCGPSLLEPYLDTARWSEVGPTMWGDSFGGVWEVLQINHGFTMIGQPVAFTNAANRYVLADSRLLDTLGIAVVREIVSPDLVILQSTGLVADINPDVIAPINSTWLAGGVYYVGIAPGTLTLVPPVGYFANPILKVAAEISGVQSGIALPWAPLANAPKEFIPVGQVKFYFTAVGITTTISGLDDDGNSLAYFPGVNTEVFVDGLNLWPSQFVATDGLTITFTPPLPNGSEIEVWTPDQPTEILVQGTTLKLDNIEALFNGVTTTFDLFYNLIPVVIQEVTSVLVWLDVNNQEPDVDYMIIPAANPANSAIQFLTAPQSGTRFWGLALSPAGASGLPPGGPAGSVLGKASGASGDYVWLTEIFGGTF